MAGSVFRTLSLTTDFTSHSNLFGRKFKPNVCEIMSLKFSAGQIVCIIFVTFVESKVLPATEAEVDNSIDNSGANNDKGSINLTMPGTKWFV